MHPNDPSLMSFIEVSSECHFPIQNIPFGIFSSKNSRPRAGVAIGDFVLDLSLLEQYGLLNNSERKIVFNQTSLNSFMELGRKDWQALRSQISLLLRYDNPLLRDDQNMRKNALIPLHEVSLHLPIKVSAYTDFYSSKEHATNVGKLFRDPENALLPNWVHMPIAYNGRASSVVISGTDVHRPNGQLKYPANEMPIFGPSQKLDFELETAFIIGKSSQHQQPVPIKDSMDYIFGMVLLNDWSARDIQQWEYVPLGPFNSKNFATSISPWIVTLDALEPFRVDSPVQLPEPLDYLKLKEKNSYEIQLEATLRTKDRDEILITKTNLRYMYWTMSQQLSHHTVSGCRVEVGDLMGSGTISGPDADSMGSLLEITSNGKRPLMLTNNEIRTFLQDGDEVYITGYAQAPTYRVGFGEVTGRIR